MTRPDDGDRSFTAGHTGIEGSVLLQLVRLEGQMDTLIKTSEIQRGAVTLELKHIREDIERNNQLYAQRDADYETRLRALESRKYVEPKTVWMAFGLFLTFGSLVVAIINLAMR